jgi:hypothetical protein
MRVHWNVVSAHPYEQLGFSEGGALPPVSDTEKRSIVSVAVYRVDPSACLRARIIAMLSSGRSQAILDTYMAPLQPLNSPEHAGMTHKHAAWKALEK